MVAVEISGPSAETTEEDQVPMRTDGSNQASLISLVIPGLSLSGER